MCPQELEVWRLRVLVSSGREINTMECFVTGGSGGLAVTAYRTTTKGASEIEETSASAFGRVVLVR